MAKLQTARRRTFDFGRSNGTDAAPWTVKTDGGIAYNMDPRRISAAPQLARARPTPATPASGTPKSGSSSPAAAGATRCTCTSRKA
jgi:hypothetical protein